MKEIKSKVYKGIWWEEMTPQNQICDEKAQ